jgi:hypothetical protein
MTGATSILDTDMKTLAGWLKAGFAWWSAELATMLPASLRGTPRRLGDHISFGGPGTWRIVGRGAPGLVVIAPGMCLLREVDLPPLGDADLAQLVALEAERLFPLPQEKMAIGLARDPAAREKVAIAVLPLDRVAAMLEELRAAGQNPRRVVMADGTAGGIDFSPALAKAGLLPPPRNLRARWWALVAALMALNFGLLVWRDMQEVAQLEALVAEQAPAVRATRQIVARIGAQQRSAIELAALRRRHDPLAVLAAVSAAMPQAAWVQRYVWQDDGLHITGNRRQGADVAGALRQSGHFTDVRSAGAEAAAQEPTGLPFDVTAKVVEPRL